MQAIRPILFTLLVVMVVGLTTFKPCYAEIYKWIDEKGTVHFTEDPSKIPERYRNKTVVSEVPESSSEKEAFSISNNSPYTHPSRKLQLAPRETAEVSQDCGPVEYEINVFMMRYLGDKSKRSATLAGHCMNILKKCCHYNPAEFAKLVDKYAKDAKWNVIPGKIPGLLSTYCGQIEPIISSEGHSTLDEERRTRKKQEFKEEEVKNKNQEEDRNPRFGEFLPRSGSGVINPRTGEFYPPAGSSGYLNPRTGEIYPKFGSGAMKR